MVGNNVNASAKKLDVAGVVDPGYSLYSGSSFDASIYHQCFNVSRMGCG
jgi:hypothetical protein